MNVLPPIISLLILRCAGTGHAVQGGAALTVEGGTWYWKVNCQGPVAGGRMMDERELMRIVRSPVRPWFRVRTNWHGSPAHQI